ncbi:C-X-C motif chemokine 11 [Fundulus heteroclitus]|uniref:C-X-C motif chemokine 11 n=1 Tax=Fundulus heteroclitus TaxID=8078 RepID=A0A3Q2NMY8_FUNHE|nr:C-X-C motif chemokine 11 [Fundulus heteroclitus]
MKSALIAFLTCLLLLCAQGQPANRSNKCKCSNSLLTKVRLQRIQTEPVVYQPSIFCPRTEIIITVANKEKCVDPKSRFGQFILNLKNKKTEAVYGTTASAQTSTSSSTTQQATSKL